jgi:hypothetical protein
VGKTTEHYKRRQQEKDERRDGWFVAAHVKANSQQHYARESDRSPQAERRSDVGGHGQDNAEASSEFSDADEGYEAAPKAGGLSSLTSYCIFRRRTASIAPAAVKASASFPVHTATWWVW